MEDNLIHQLENDLQDFEADKSDLESLSRACKDFIKWSGIVQTKEAELKDIKDKVRKCLKRLYLRLCNN